MSPRGASRACDLLSPHDGGASRFPARATMSQWIESRFSRVISTGSISRRHLIRSMMGGPLSAMVALDGRSVPRICRKKWSFGRAGICIPFSRSHHAIPPLTPLHVRVEPLGRPLGLSGVPPPWLPDRRKSISCMAAIENTPAACCTKTRRTDMHSRYRMAGAGRPGISEPSRTTVSSSGLSGTRFTMSPVTGCPG